MTTSLVTGAAGFIGSHVASELLKDGHKVVALDDLSGGYLENVPSGAVFVEGSITNVDLIDKLFKEIKFDYVYHLAAYAAEGLSHFIKRFNYNNNLIGSVNLINASVNHKVKCFVFTSSIAVYGPNQVPMTESMTPTPEDPYGIAKYAVEMDLKEAKRMFGLNSIVFRPHNVYGEHQNIGDPYRNVIGIFMNQILQGKPMTIFGDGRQTRAFTHVSDVAPVVAKSVNYEAAYNEVFNIGADQPWEILQLATEVANVMGVEPKIQHLETRHEVVHAFSNHDKVTEFFSDIKTTTSLTEGLEKMAEWVKKNGAKVCPPFENIEVWKNMPESWIKLVNRNI